jgi:hypothetical protein
VEGEGREGGEGDVVRSLVGWHVGLVQRSCIDDGGGNMVQELVFVRRSHDFVDNDLCSIFLVGCYPSLATEVLGRRR